MTEKEKSDISTQPSNAPPIKQRQEAPTSFVSLAKTIRSRTTDLLAIAIVIIGGVTLGSQVMRWWATDDSDLTPAVDTQSNISWGAGDTPVTLEFGDRPLSIERQPIRGDREAAFDRLVKKCAVTAEETRLVATAIHPAEQKLLKLLQRQTPVRQKTGAWQVFRIEFPMTLVIATRHVDSNSISQPEKQSQRVVCWGMAQPSRKDAWVLFTMRPNLGAAAPIPERGQVALPAGSMKIMSLRDASGGALVAFEGEGTTSDWQQWFDNWFEGRRWRLRRQWTHSDAGWSASFVPADVSGTGRIDVSYSTVGDNRLSGIVSVISVAKDTEKGMHR